MKGPRLSWPAGLVSQSTRLPTWIDLLSIALIGSLFILHSLSGRINHDEDQYVAGAALSWGQLIYRDFMHLQTPLQAWVFAPIAALFDGHALIALRVANAVAALLALIGAYGAQRCTGARRRLALVATGALALCPPFGISATVVRNDMLPLAFSAFGILAALLAVRRGTTAKWLLAGLLFGLAASAKISHAFLLAGAGLFLLWRAAVTPARDAPVRALVAYGIGGSVGLLPILIVVLAAPAAARFGIVDYFGPGVFDWYRRNGLAEMLTLRSNLSRTWHYLAGGPALPALVVVLLTAVRGRRNSVAEVGLLAFLLVAGGIAALLPTPSWSYYQLTFLLPLFITLGLLLERLIGHRPAPALVATGVLIGAALSPAIDLARRTYYVLDTRPSEWAILRVSRQAHWIGSMLRQTGARGPIATLSPFATLDSGFPLDRRFATGVFVFRSGHLIPAADHARFHTVGPQTLRQALDRQPPAAIVTGYEQGSRIFSIRPDDDLRSYALSRGYRLYKSPFGAAQLFVAPTRPTS